MYRCVATCSETQEGLIYLRMLYGWFCSRNSTGLLCEYCKVLLNNIIGKQLNYTTRGVQLIMEHFRLYVIWCVIVRISRDLLSYVRDRCSFRYVAKHGSYSS